MNLSIKPIRTESDLEEALARIRAIFHAEDGTPDADELEVLTQLVYNYERSHHPVPPPDPVEAIRFTMEQRGLKPKDLIPYLGAQSRASEVLARKRSLTVEMIRRLHFGLGIPYESLLGPETKARTS